LLKGKDLQSASERVTGLYQGAIQMRISYHHCVDIAPLIYRCSRPDSRGVLDRKPKRCDRHSPDIAQFYRKGSRTTREQLAARARHLRGITSLFSVLERGMAEM
jgi:hypothetical protein